ncbi:MAG: sensor histidine kinase [Alphaproteobacteria bacterium]|nr:sensor histidine kinase [Alphaproteobacteria bacterium]
MTTKSSATEPLTVDKQGMGFFLDRLGADCAPLQFLRELTQNAIEAIGRTREKKGEIVWDVDWVEYDLRGVCKLCITDNGDGMTGSEMAKHINSLSSSASAQSFQGNFGVGAKIAAATKNHAGLIYLSWKQGRGSMIHFWRDPETGEYGLRRQQDSAGTFGAWGEVEDTVRPDLIGEHGTRVTLLGMTADANTMKPPDGAPSPSRWIAKYLNSRYYRFPAGVTIKAREGWEYPREDKDRNLLREIEGQEEYLRKHSRASGKVRLTDATVHWWILKDEKAISQNSGHAESSGHVAGLYQNELYELVTARKGTARLQQFGVILGQKFVVLYVEPDLVGRSLMANTARTQLMIAGDPLPWTDWAAEFREQMPEDIQKLIDEIAAKGSEDDHSKSIRDRLRGMLDLFKVSRYRPTPEGRLTIADPIPNAGGNPAGGGSGGGRAGGGTREGKAGPVGGAYSVFLKKDGIAGSQVRPNPFPEVQWVSVEDGTRETDYLADRAAQYLPDQHLLQVNADFRVFTDMRKHWEEKYAQDMKVSPASVRATIKSEVHNWYEQALVETIIGLQALRGSREWSDEQLFSAMCEEALTAVVMQRYHPYNSISRGLGTKLKSLKEDGLPKRAAQVQEG